MKEAFFLYKSNPFRPLYHGAGPEPPAFRPPVSRTEQSYRRHALFIWYFIDRDTARGMAKTNNCEMAKASEFAKLNKGQPHPEQPLRPERVKRPGEKPKVPKGSDLASLA